jgi:phosphoribosylglycinamide formyltransferase 1
MIRFGWFATARTLGGSSAKLFAAALEAIDDGLDARIEFVFSNREPGEFESSDRFFEIVCDAGIPLITLSNNRFRREAGGKLSRDGEALPAWRREYDAAVAKLLSKYDWDLGLLAGYMVIFTYLVCERWPLINLHPAAPGGPIGTWQQVIWELIEAKATESGVQCNVATPELDRGPVVSYCRYSVGGGELERLWERHGSRALQDLKAEGEANPLFQAIRSRGVVRELPLLLETMRTLANREVKIESNTAGFQVVDAAGRAIDGRDMTQVVEASIASSAPPK